jgi:hypothetical protein
LISVINAYRVLLTRARQGIVIYIPEGEPADITCPAAFYDGTAEFLLKCGPSFLSGGYKRASLQMTALSRSLADFFHNI